MLESLVRMYFVRIGETWQDLLFSPFLHVVHEHVDPGKGFGLRLLFEEHSEGSYTDVRRHVGR